MKTILITGCSSGFGHEIATFFLERGWKVIATMRTPKEGILPKSDNLRLLALDVTKAESIAKAIAEAGTIDVLVNNAGYGMLNALEGTSMEKIRDIFETNTFGTMATIKAVLPQMRERKSGHIINVTSSVTYKSLPLLSIYTATKAAVNAFTESLALELVQFNIRVNLVLPGRSPTTKFAENAGAGKFAFPDAYQELVGKVFAGWSESKDPVTVASDVAEAVWKVVNDPSVPVKLPAGPDAVEWSKG